MDEILQKLLSSELLSEDVKAEISSKWKTSIDQYKTAVREEVTLTVRSEIAEQWANERDSLIENVDKFVSSKVQEEIKELQGDIDRFRDLEVEYASKITEEKQRMAGILSEELDQLVDKMDAFFDLRLQEEFTELREDLEVVKQNEFGRKIYEAFSDTFAKTYVDEDSVNAKLQAAVAKLADATKTIAKLEESQSTMVRASKLEKILAPLSGSKREQMAFILQNVETGRLEEAYTHFIGRVLKEESKDRQEAADQQVLKESVKNVVKTGNEPTASTKPSQSSAEKFSQLRKLAGMAS